jgi:Flp pilus assembly protein TadD
LQNRRQRRAQHSISRHAAQPASNRPTPRRDRCAAAREQCRRGNIQQAHGALEEAISAYTEAIRLSPALVEAHINLATALGKMGRFAEAANACRIAIGLNPGLAEAHANLGTALSKQGQLEEASAAYLEALRVKADDPAILANLGNVLRQLGRLDDCIACLRRLTVLTPADAGIWCNLGCALCENGAPGEAETCHRHALELAPDLARAENGLGNALHNQGRFDEAISHYRRAIALHPAFAEPHCNLGVTLQEHGHLDAALACFERAVQLAPSRTAFHRMLATTGRIMPGSPQMQRLEALAADSADMQEADRMELHFALGSVYAAHGRHDQAAPHLLEGNRLKRRRTAYDETATLSLFARIRSVFTPALLRGADGGSQHCASAIFVLGMPRSGTSLVEQILASHPHVHGAGEVQDLPGVVHKLESQEAAGVFPECASRLSRQALSEGGRAYLQALRARAPSAAYVTDKLPDNFLRVGLIHLVLPGARIIHVSRDPIDTCLSCFSRLFTGALPYTYNLEELGRYYRAYRELMAYWKETLPAGTILDVRYEDIITDLEGQARRMFHYCGIPWNEACLRFHQTQRVVQTASAPQVRRPLYASSVGRWAGAEGLVKRLRDEMEKEGLLF